MSRELRVASFDGTILSVLDEGPTDAPAVLFSHYLGGSKEGWEAQARALAGAFRVVRYDTRGHGASDAPDGPYAVEDLGRDLAAVQDALGLARSHVVGLSLGGMAAMWLASLAPERVDRLVLANTTPFIPNKAPWDGLISKALSEGMDEIATQTVPGWLSDGFKAREPERTRDLVQIMGSMPPAGYAGCAAVLRDVDLRADLGRISASALIISGAEDGPRAAAAPMMAEAIGNASLAVIERAAHLSHVENPDGFTLAVRMHLS